MSTLGKEKAWEFLTFGSKIYVVDQRTTLRWSYSIPVLMSLFIWKLIRRVIRTVMCSVELFWSHINTVEQQNLCQRFFNVVNKRYADLSQIFRKKNIEKLASANPFKHTVECNGAEVVLTQMWTTEWHINLIHFALYVLWTLWILLLFLFISSYIMIVCAQTTVRVFCLFFFRHGSLCVVWLHEYKLNASLKTLEFASDIRCVCAFNTQSNVLCNVFD